MVCVLLALLLSMFSVRMTSTRDHSFDTTVAQVGDLLMMYALRSEHARQPVGIMIEPGRNAIVLMKRELGTTPEDPRLWKIDPMVQGVKLPDFMTTDDLQVRVDGDVADLVQWPLTAMPGEDRPLVEIELQYDRRSVLLTLAPHALSPQRQEAGVETVPMREPEDLDTTGRWQEDW